MPTVNPATTRNPYKLLFGFVSVAESISVVGVKKGLLRGFMTATIEGGQTVSINVRNAACLVGFSPYYGSFISMFGYRSNSLSTIMSPSLSNLISITKDDNVYAVKISNIHTSPVSITYTYIDYNDCIA